MSAAAPPPAAHPPEPPSGASPAADGALAGLLEALARAVPPESVDELWIFPPRRVGPAESTVLVVAAFETATGGPAPPAAAGERRRVLTARYTATRDARGRTAVQEELAEHGVAPAERVGRVVDGVLRRLDDDPAVPRHARISGDPARWAELLCALR